MNMDRAYIGPRIYFCSFLKFSAEYVVGISSLTGH